MITKALFSIMAALTVVACSDPVGSQYPQDKFVAKDGTEIILTFYNHASIAVEAAGHRIYIDPANATREIAWEKEPKADLILITHDHSDHFSDSVNVILNGTGAFKQMKPGESLDPFDGIHVEAVPAYNISEGHLDFHPQARGDAGTYLPLEDPAFMSPVIPKTMRTCLPSRTSTLRSFLSTSPIR